MTKARHKLIEDARRAGYNIHHDGSATLITRHEGRREALMGICLYEDGTAFDLSVPMSIAKGIRSYRIMRHVLRLPHTLDHTHA